VGTNSITATRARRCARSFQLVRQDHEWIGGHRHCLRAFTDCPGRADLNLTAFSVISLVLGVIVWHSADREIRGWPIELLLRRRQGLTVLQQSRNAVVKF
jgi:hypothetical protein